LKSVGVPAGDDQIGTAIPVEVGGRNAARAGWRGDVAAYEAACRLSAKNRDGVRIGIGDREVGNACD
jgi:hypothetical protein